jgi:hypothetical protein
VPLFGFRLDSPNFRVRDLFLLHRVFVLSLFNL